jgi:hypothetical protein
MSCGQLQGESLMPNILVRLTEFSDLIDSYTAGFVGREWLVDQVSDLLDDPGCRFVVLTGGAGVGKSAFMAHLATSHPQRPQYFIRRGQFTRLGEVGAPAFRLQISFPLDCNITESPFIQQQHTNSRLC